MTGSGRVMLSTALLVLHAQRVQADEPPAPARTFRVEYDAPAECGGAAHFVREVGARSTRIGFSTEGELVRLTITHPVGVSGFTGRMIIGGAANSTRELGAEECRDLLSGLALALVLAVDPESLTRLPEPRKELKEPSPSVESAPERPAPAESVPWFVGVLGTIGTTPVPAPVIGVGGFVERGGWFAVRVAATTEFGAARTTPDYAVRFQTFGAAVSGCPMASPVLWFAVGGCATASFGVVRAATTLATVPQEQHVTVRPRFDMALGPALSAFVGSVRISMVVELTFPVVRDDFVIAQGATDEVVHRADPVGARATLGLSVPLSELGFGH